MSECELCHEEYTLFRRRVSFKVSNYYFSFIRAFYGIVEIISKYFRKYVSHADKHFVQNVFLDNPFAFHLVVYVFAKFV